jgi:hypothetical protein
MPFSFFQRKTISPASTKEKKGKTNQRLSFTDNRTNSDDVSNLQSNIDNSENVQSIYQLQKKVDNTNPLPENLKEGVEQLSGEDMSDVKVNYNSNKPKQFDAHAYANGSEIEIAPGQEKHLPHEAWHVVQQKQNKVKPIEKTNYGNLINDEQILEDESDKMGSKALEYSSPSNENLKRSKTISPVFQLAKDEKKKKKSEEEKEEDEEKENVDKEKKNEKKRDEEVKDEKEKKDEIEGVEKKDENKGDGEIKDRKEAKISNKEGEKKEKSKRKSNKKKK